MAAGLSLASLSHAHSPVCTAQCVCLAWCSPYVCVFLYCSQDTRGLGQATDTHVGLAEPKDKAAQLPPCGQAVWHKGRYHLSAHILVLHRYIYAPNVSLSLDIATSSSADKDLLWGYAPFLCRWQVGMKVWYKYTLIRSKIWPNFPPWTNNFCLAQNFF